jgi:hypothetical protein
LRTHSRFSLLLLEIWLNNSVIRLYVDPDDEK